MRASISRSSPLAASVVAAARHGSHDRTAKPPASLRGLALRAGSTRDVVGREKVATPNGERDAHFVVKLTTGEAHRPRHHVRAARLRDGHELRRGLGHEPGHVGVDSRRRASTGKRLNTIDRRPQPCASPRAPTGSSCTRTTTTACSRRARLPRDGRCSTKVASREPRRLKLPGAHADARRRSSPASATDVAGREHGPEAERRAGRALRGQARHDTGAGRTIDERHVRRLTETGAPDVCRSSACRGRRPPG